MPDTQWALWEREAECAAIERAMKSASQGHGELLLLRGPAGIGKTRLLDEVRTCAEQADALLARARGLELERDFAFGIVRQLFEPLLGFADNASRASLWAGPAAQARSIFAGHSRAPQDSADVVGDFAMLHGLYWLTLNACRDHPLVLLVDDLQWCDAPSLRFLAYLLPRLEESMVLVAAAVRTGEEPTDQFLADRIITDPSAQVLEPLPLSRTATGWLLESVLPGSVDPAFAAACHTSSGGNPLLVCELALALTADGIDPTPENIHQVTDLGAQAVTRLVQARLARLPETAAALARAVAVLGDRVDWALAVDLAAALTPAARSEDDGMWDWLDVGTALERAEILRLTQEAQAGLRPLVSFVHPIIRSAVYATIDRAAQAHAHAHAANLLATAQADPERIAAHLLHVPPASSRSTVARLQSAAHAAQSRGAPGSAYAYLRRALVEPPAPEQRLPILVGAGRAALDIDLRAAADLLQQAYGDLTDPADRADIAGVLGTAYVYLSDPDHGFALQLEALAGLPPHEEDRRRHLLAGLLTMATWSVPGRTEVLGLLPELEKLPRHDSVGGRLLECAIACRQMMAFCEPTATPRARSALADGSVVEQANGDAALMCGWDVLINSDDDTGLVEASLDAAIKQAHSNGSLYALTQAYMHKGYDQWRQGRLDEAETAYREAVRLAQLAGLAMAPYYAVPLFGETLAELGRMDEAEAVLREAGITLNECPPGPNYYAFTTLAQVNRQRGNHQAALAAAQEAQASFSRYGIQNPVATSWRSETALALSQLGQAAQARQVAREEVELARQWGRPRGLGRALRVCGVVVGGEEGIGLLQEAVTVLARSTARLEHAKALAELGAALRRAGHRVDSRSPLRQAIDAATRCNAGPILAFARSELAAAGGKPRRAALTGPESLTPSERRVAELAVEGITNRRIAQELYVTPKTVEVHLSAVYRKLGIANRNQLSVGLDMTSQAGS